MKKELGPMAKLHGGPDNMALGGKNSTGPEAMFKISKNIPPKTDTIRVSKKYKPGDFVEEYELEKEIKRQTGAFPQLSVQDYSKVKVDNKGRNIVVKEGPQATDPPKMKKLEAITGSIPQESTGGARTTENMYRSMRKGQSPDKFGLGTRTSKLHAEDGSKSDHYYRQKAIDDTKEKRTGNTTRKMERHYVYNEYGRKPGPSNYPQDSKIGFVSGDKYKQATDPSKKIKLNKKK